jgi:D-lactate dehydrogenase
MKLAFFEVQNWEKSILEEGLKGNRIKFSPKILGEKDLKLIKDIEILSIFIYSKITKEIISRLPQLKLIVTRSTGFDHIDLNECKKRKILVYNMPNYGENTVAEHTFALILSLSRKLKKTFHKTAEDDFTIDGLKGFDLKGKTIGVIGAGRIGKNVIRIARGFEMNILASDSHPDSFLAEQLRFKYTSLNELLKKSDIVTIHIPYTKENHHFFNAKLLEMMKNSAVLINTSRGGIIDTPALIKALNKKKIAGAGLDVIEGEQLIKEEHELLYENKNPKAIKQMLQAHKIIDRANVVFTPHVAFYTQEALERIIYSTVQYILDFKKGKIHDDCKVC